MRSPLFEKRIIFLLLCCLCLGGFSGCGWQANNNAPRIEFNKIPPADKGGSTKLDIINGKVTNARPGQQIVLFARSGAWYVQPFTDQQFTKIGPDATWGNTTHLGSEYAALLVEPGYLPPNVTDELPRAGDGRVIAVTVVPGDPVFWQKRWFKLTVGAVGLVVLLASYRFRLRRLTKQLNVRFEERLGERMRIAQELHDTLLQSFVGASMQLDVAVDNLPADSPARASFESIRRMMTQVIEEGQHTVRGLRSDSGISLDLGEALKQVGQNIAGDEDVSFDVSVTGRVRTLHPVSRDSVFRLGREALTNAFRHEGVQNIALKLEYAHNQLRIHIRDDGRWMNPSEESAKTDEELLSELRRQADRIGSRLKVRRFRTGGMELTLIVPGHVAFQG